MAMNFETAVRVPDQNRGAYFSPEAQEVFMENQRVYTVDDGREGWYIGRGHDGLAVVLFDRMSGRAPYEPEAVGFERLRNLYR